MLFVCWRLLAPSVCCSRDASSAAGIVHKMEPVQPRRMTYAEQLEAMRPPCGFCILADGTILLSNRPETYTAEMVVDAYEAWRKMKADGLLPDRCGEHVDGQVAEEERPQMPVAPHRSSSSSATPYPDLVAATAPEAPMEDEKPDEKKPRRNKKKKNKN